LGRKTAPEKIATFLLEMSERLAGEGCGTAFGPTVRFTLPFGRQQIADILGTTIETVSRQLTRLQRDGVIDLPARREVLIRDRDRLEMLAG
jgi:CRP/FNR family transcriptional regulator, anaerobic regulatory protein